MLPGSFHDADVLNLSHRVLVNGVERDVDSWSVDRDLKGDLPKQVASVSGVIQATGKIEWTPAHVVSEHSPNPWNANGGWVPSRGDRVEIFVSDGVTEWKRFHGLIDVTRGDIGSGFASTIIDDYDKLSASVAHHPMLSIMPPRTISGTGWWRLPGIHPLYYVDLALRRSRFFVTPPREANAILSVPMQGSLWPHWGVLDRNGENMASGGANRVAPWGLAKGNFVAYYAPSNSPSMSQTVQMSFMVAPDHSSATDLTLDYGAGDFLRVSVSSDRVVTVYKNSTDVAYLTLDDDDVIVSALFKNGVVTVRTNTRRESSGSFTASGAGLSTVRINAGTNASIAGFQVSRPQTATHEHFSTRVPLSARFDVTSLRLSGGLTAAPNIEDRTAESLISEINDAILAAMWIDETGVLQWAQSDTLRRRDPVKTVTTADDIFSLSWESGLLQSAASVTVKGKRPAITRSRWRVITVAEESGRQTLRSGDELEIFFEASSDEDWVSPSFDFIELGGSTGIWGPFNNPEYGTVGLYYERDGEEVTGTTYPVTITTHRLGNQKTLIKYAAGNWPSAVEGVLSTPPEETAFTVLWPRHRGQPAVRQKAMGRIEWYDDKQTMTGAGGPGPELVHDVGVWATTESNIGSVDYWERIGAYIQSQVTVPQPVVRGVSISPDPRLQLADVITIESNLLGVKLTALVTGVSEGADSEGYHQKLDVRVLSAVTSSLTYEAFQQGLPGTNLTYEQWQALGPIPQTYAEFNDEGD